MLAKRFLELTGRITCSSDELVSYKHGLLQMINELVTQLEEMGLEKNQRVLEYCTGYVDTLTYKSDKEDYNYTYYR